MSLLLDALQRASKEKEKRGETKAPAAPKKLSASAAPTKSAPVTPQGETFSSLSLSLDTAPQFETKADEGSHTSSLAFAEFKLEEAEAPEPQISQAAPIATAAVAETSTSALSLHALEFSTHDPASGHQAAETLETLEAVAPADAVEAPLTLAGESLAQAPGHASPAFALHETEATTPISEAPPTPRIEPSIPAPRERVASDTETGASHTPAFDRSASIAPVTAEHDTPHAAAPRSHAPEEHVPDRYAPASFRLDSKVTPPKPRTEHKAIDTSDPEYLPPPEAPAKRVLSPSGRSQPTGKNLSPKVAKEILNAGLPKPKRSLNIRLMALGSVALVLASIGAAFMLGLLDPLLGVTKSSLVPVAGVSPAAPPPTTSQPPVIDAGVQDTGAPDTSGVATQTAVSPSPQAAGAIDPATSGAPAAVTGAAAQPAPAANVAAVATVPTGAASASAPGSASAPVSAATAPVAPIAPTVVAAPVAPKEPALLKPSHAAMSGGSDQTRERSRTGRSTVFVAKPAGPGDLDLAYAALNEGKLDDAAVAYQRALKSNPNERDALLGLAHISQRQGHRDEARSYYQHVLRLEPDNPTANAGMLSLMAEGDLQGASSRARDLVERAPDSAAGFATLGGILAREGRIADAQQAYFKALSLEPGNAYHAYNLAVALDRLHKLPQARSYYEQSLALAAKSPVDARFNFPHDAVLKRLEQIGGSGNAATTYRPAPTGAVSSPAQATSATTSPVR